MTTQSCQCKLLFRLEVLQCWPQSQWFQVSGTLLIFEDTVSPSHTRSAMLIHHHHDAFFHLQLQCAGVELNLFCNLQLCFLFLRFLLLFTGVASSCLPARLCIDLVCSSSAFENSKLKLINFDFFSTAWINNIWAVSFLVCIIKSCNLKLQCCIQIFEAKFVLTRVGNFLFYCELPIVTAVTTFVTGKATVAHCRHLAT